VCAGAGRHWRNPKVSFAATSLKSMKIEGDNLVNTCHPLPVRRHAATQNRRFANGLLPTLALIIIVCLGASAAFAQVPFLYAPLVPGVKAPNSAAFTVTVNGTGFVSGAVVNWNGTPLTTTFVSQSELTATVEPANIPKASTAIVTVTNPVPTGNISNFDYFEVLKGTFTIAYSKLDYNTDIGPQDVTTADFNGDGILDVALPTSNNTVSVLLGAGGGVFNTSVQYGVIGNPYAITHGDFSNNGIQDLATADYFTAEVSVLMGNGDGTFQAHEEYSAGSGPVEIATADVNGDGFLDLIVVNNKANSVSVLLGNGNGTFQSPVNYATGNGPEAVAIGDFTGSGVLDLAVANNTDGTVSILLGNGNGTFQAAVPYATAINPTSVVAGDFGTNGVLDLAVGTSNKSVSVLLGNGNGTFQNAVNYGIGAESFALAAADVNSDGKLDLISANYNDNTISTLIGNGNGTFKTETVYLTNLGPVGLAIGDFNNDGKLDVAVASGNANTVSVLLDSPITLSPTILPFGTVTSGDPSAAKTVTLKNTGTTAYTMGTISMTGSYNTDFKVSNNTCPEAGSTVAAGASCVISVTFDPTASETANSQLLITQTSGSLIGVQMTGAGNVPILMNPRTITFPGYTLVGVTSAPEKTTFTNESGVPVTLTSLTLQGADPNEFSQTSTCPGVLNNAPGTLAPGASCTSEIYFTPTQSGLAQVTAIYSGNFTVGEAGTLVSGNGTAVKVTPTSLKFPSTPEGSTSAPMTVSFENVGSTSLSISSVNIINGSVPGQNFTQTNTCQPSVPANTTCTFTVTFSPQATGAITATLSIGDPDPTGPQQIKLSGTGTAAAVAKK
jgi:hypothetical protein